MRRRSFISTASLTGVALAVGTPLALFGQSPQLLTNEVVILNKFKKEVSIGLEGQANSKKMLFELTTPAKVIKRKTTKHGFELSFKNYAGNLIKISTKKGNSSIHIS